MEAATNVPWVDPSRLPTRSPASLSAWPICGKRHSREVRERHQVGSLRDVGGDRAAPVERRVDGRALDGDLARRNLVVEHVITDGEDESEITEQLRRLVDAQAAQLRHTPWLRPVGHDQLDLGTWEHLAAEGNARRRSTR